MHIPVLLCGFLAGPVYAAAVGLVAPLLRFILFGMPPMIFPMPIGLSMTFELATYGLMVGLLFKMLPQKNISVYVALIIAMLSGRVIWGIAMWIITSIIGMPFSLDAFLAGAFINAVPGIILHIVLIPPIVIALKRVRFIESAHHSGA
jgi:riboflavin transporter FmnP